MTERQRLIERYGADVVKHYDTADKRGGELGVVEKFTAKIEEQTIATRYGADIAQYFEHIEKGGITKATPEPEIDWTDKKIMDVLGKCKQAVHDAIYLVKLHLSTAYPFEYDSDLEYYKKLIYEICRKHLDNYFYPEGYGKQK